MIEEYSSLCTDFPIYSIEDGLSEDDWSGWGTTLYFWQPYTIGFGDDLYVTQARYVKRGIDSKSGNAVLVKLNQVGSVSKLLKRYILRKRKFRICISHRSGKLKILYCRSRRWHIGRPN
ncbi:MAG: hypothetical protein CM1200mP39_10370 [Dehalococcoidia bacterium]|nr:MAG: hypothetical protein CM1200mP39_10370 [Dehalococcoidia bacterium]